MRIFNFYLQKTDKAFFIFLFLFEGLKVMSWPPGNCITFPITQHAIVFPYLYMINYCMLFAQPSWNQRNKTISRLLLRNHKIKLTVFPLAFVCTLIHLLNHLVQTQRERSWLWCNILLQSLGNSKCSAKFAYALRKY